VTHPHTTGQSDSLKHEKCPFLCSCTHAWVHCLRHSYFCICRGGWARK